MEKKRRWVDKASKCLLKDWLIRKQNIRIWQKIGLSFMLQLYHFDIAEVLTMLGFFFTLVVVLFIISQAICLLTVRILLTEKPGLKLNCFLKKKLDRFEGEQIKYTWVFPQIQLLNRPQSIWGNETRIYCKCMDHQITAWARWPNIFAYKMYFPTNLYLGQPLRWR